MLEIDSITAGYGELIILKDVSLSMQEREIIAIVGSNGAGKSTLLRVISCFIKVSKGNITFNKEQISRLPSHKIVNRGIVQVPEARQLFPEMNVLDNLNIGSYPSRARARKKEKLNQVYQLFPILKNRKNQRAGSLSGGEQQMLAIGRAIMSCPKLLMFDEPSLGLAPVIVEHIFEVIRNIRDEGVSILIVEQNVFESLQLSDRGYVLENGEIVLAGTREELLNNESVKSAYLGI
ncbi:MAG: ABC transporter ATP-binding protein [Pseudomonadota bacterium]